jgi:hypothetical protein
MPGYHFLMVGYCFFRTGYYFVRLGYHNMEDGYSISRLGYHYLKDGYCFLASVTVTDAKKLVTGG